MSLYKYLVMSASIYLLLSCRCAISLPADPEALGMQKDARLDRLVTLNHTDIQMDLLLSKISDQHLILQVGRSCSGQKLQLRLRQRTLRVLMQSLAEMLPGTWTPREDKQGYVLNMTPQAARKRQRWWELLAAERERLLAERRAALLNAMRAEPDLSKPGAGPDSSNTAGYQIAMASGQFFRSLPAALQEQIAAQINDINAYIPGPSLISSQDATVVHLRDLPEATQKAVNAKVRAEAGNLPDVNLPASDFSLEFVNTGDYVSTRLLSDSGQERALFDLYSSSRNMPPLSLDHSNIVSIVEHLGKAAPYEWQQFAAYQKSHFWHNELPHSKPGSFWPRLRTADRLHQISENADLDYIADYDSISCRPLKPEQRCAALKRPLEEELNLLAVEQDVSWKKRDDALYLLRNNRWYRDDLLEVPTTTATKWLQQLIAQKVNRPFLSASQSLSPAQLKEQIGWEAEVLTTLTLWQLGQGFTCLAVDDRPSSKATNPPDAAPQNTLSSPWSEWNTWFPLAMAGPRIIQDRRLINFYMGLEEARQMGLLQGNLNFQTLSPQQQEEACLILPLLRANRKQRNIVLRLQSAPVSMLIAPVPLNKLLDTRPALQLAVVTEPQMESTPGSK